MSLLREKYRILIPAKENAEQVYHFIKYGKFKEITNA